MSGGSRLAHLSPRSWDKAALGLILLGSAVLRLLFLGYSHFQGDEIGALFPAAAAFPEFLFEHTKGPIELLVTLSVRLISGGYEEWLTRLPFSLASQASVYVLCRFVWEAYGARAALWAAALLGSCGLLVALGRIAQYQSFVMLSVGLAALLSVRWIQRGDPRFLYGAQASFAFGVLSHYDALPFLPALALLLGFGLWRRDRRTWPWLRHLILAASLALVLVGLFYVPFILRPGFPPVQDYLRSRVAANLGLDTFQRVGRLLALYLPPLYLPLVVPLAMIGAAASLRGRTWQHGLVLVLWFAAPFSFYMLLGGDPRSHVYVFFVPGLILGAIGVDAILSAIRSPLVRRAMAGMAGAAIVAFAAVTYYMIVDHTIEHPWERKTVLGYALPNLVTDRVQGILGFPYRRGLEQVGEMFRAGRLQGSYDSNERASTVGFYVGAPQSNTPDYYVFVLRPYSLRRELPDSIRETYRPIDTIEVAGRPTIELYAAPWKVP